MPEKKKKKHFGDRRDATLITKADPLHLFMPYIYVNEADNEAFIQEQIDITNLLAYVEKKNGENPEYKYTPFHVIVAAIVKMVHLRPVLNRFYKGYRYYQRDDVSVAFTAKNVFSDTGTESLLMMKYDESSTVDSIHNDIKERLIRLRSKGEVDNSTDQMGSLVKLPRWLLRIVGFILRRLDFYGKVPDSLIKEDPNHATVFVSNLGSLNLRAGYHHLSNWGTCSVFVVIGRYHKAPVFADDGSYEMRDVVDIGITLDERIGDGFYYSKSLKLLKHLLNNPELLERPAGEEVDYE